MASYTTQELRTRHKGYAPRNGGSLVWRNPVDASRWLIDLRDGWLGWVGLFGNSRPMAWIGHIYPTIEQARNAQRTLQYVTVSMVFGVRKYKDPLIEDYRILAARRLYR